MPDNSSPIRPTKKQREILTFIGDFIAKHGYSPSYREIMSGLNYSSVATVSLHVNSLIKRGHLKKRDHSARSIEIVSNPNPTAILSNQILPDQEKWLVEKIEHAFRDIEQSSEKSKQDLQNLFILVEALKVLGLSSAAQGFGVRLNDLNLIVSKAQ